MTDGDLEVFLSLVELHRRYLYKLAFRITGNAQDAKDVVQEGLLNAYLHLDGFEKRAGFCWYGNIPTRWLRSILAKGNDGIDPGGTKCGNRRGKRRRPRQQD